MQEYIAEIDELEISDRVAGLKNVTLTEERYASIEQALIITDVYKNNEDLPVKLKRAQSLYESLRRIEIRIDPGELIVGNRTAGVRGGVIFPESGLSWVDKEIEGLYERPQDKFRVRPEDIAVFRSEILPYWQGRTLEDRVEEEIGPVKRAIGKVVKINQTDHAQGHICPNTAKWLSCGPAGLLAEVTGKLDNCSDESREFYQSMKIVLEGALIFIGRYEELATSLAAKESSAQQRQEYLDIAAVCSRLKVQPAASLREALQSVWFLYVILQMESNASSFSPGRMDQYLYPYFQREVGAGSIDLAQALELIECLWLKFNQLVYLRSSSSAKYFAGFPIGFNVAIGGQLEPGENAANELSYLFLRAQEHLGLSQPNLSARLYSGSPQEFIEKCATVIGKGSGMPQIFNDEAVIPALEAKGYSREDAVNYAIVGCVELTTHGNALGWSDAAMFNLVKALELTLNDGVCLISGKRIGVALGTLEDYRSFEELEEAYRNQIEFFYERMIQCCEVVERLHGEILPSAFLSSVIDDCIAKGIDVTQGGAHYNLSGIQAIQPANVADSMAAVKKLVYDEKRITAADLMAALRNDFAGDEALRLTLLNHAPKYGNDVVWVDEIGNKWIKIFADRLKDFTNIRGGIYHAGLYTVSAHVPMGANVGATPDGRKSGTALADGGMSAVYGRDISGPTALLNSVSRIDSSLGSNGTLLNMKFSPDVFRNEKNKSKFVALLRQFVKLGIIHVQFNVVTREELLAAQQNPEQYRSMTIRVAGYTAYFTELAPDLQTEIIARTSYE